MDFKIFFFFFCCCDLYSCNKNFIYKYKIVLEVGRGGSPWGPKGRGWGKVVCPAPRGGAGMGKGNNHAGRGRRSHPPAPPRPIAIPGWNRQMWEKKVREPLNVIKELSYVMLELQMWQWNCQMWGEKKKETTKYDKRTVTCDIGIAQCEDETVKCEKKVR